MIPTRRPPARGFSLIEMILVVAIIGIISALLVPNLLDALQKANQKDTVRDIREIGTAWLAWLTDQVSAAAAGQSQTYDFGVFTEELSSAKLFKTLYVTDEMFYAQWVPRVDGWGHTLDYAWSGDVLSPQVLGIRSRGRDGQADSGAPIYPQGPFKATDYTSDIVWADGLFVRYPVGARVE